MLVNDKNNNVEVVLTSKKGTKIYALKDLTTISAHRGVAAEKAKRFASLCITEDELKKIVNRGIEAINKNQDLVTPISILSELKFRVEMICEENSLLELSYIYLMIEGEDEEKPSQEFNRKKAEFLELEPELKGFFLRSALQLVNNFSQKPGVDLLSYLAETRNLVDRMKRFTQSTH